MVYHTLRNFCNHNPIEILENEKKIFSSTPKNTKTKIAEDNHFFLLNKDKRHTFTAPIELVLCHL